MTKKENLIQILEWLQDSWSVARGLIILVRESAEDASIIEWLIQVIEWAIESSADAVSRERLQQVRDQLKAIQEQEKKEQKSTQKEAEWLISTLI